MEILYEKAGTEDIDKLLTVCRLAAQEEDSQWNDLYPDRETLEQDLSRDGLYKIKLEGKTAGLIAMGELGEYGDLDWRGGGRQIAEMARLGLLPEYQHRGLARQVVSAALDYVGRLGYDTVRFLANPQNRRASGLYDSMGFDNQGQIRLWDMDFYMYQVVLEKRLGI